MEVALELRTAARTFRQVLASDDVEEREFARHVRNALARVYLAAALLGPPTTPETDDIADTVRESRDSRALGEKLRVRFGDADEFVDVYDPTGTDSDDRHPIRRSLAQELVEIDEDLADTIVWLEEDVPDALWQARWAFENHWGQHAVACLRPLHQLATYGVV